MPQVPGRGATGSSVIGVYLAPREGRWWLDYPSLFPDRRSSVQIMENVVYPEALTVEPSEAVPCGATCEGCPFAERYGCRGCLAVSGVTG